MLNNMTFDIGGQVWDDNRQGPWVSKTDVVQFTRCPYRVSLNHQKGIPYGDFLKPDRRRFFFAAGIELETELVDEATESEELRLVSSIGDIHSQDGLVKVLSPIRNHELGIVGWPDMLIVEGGRLLPVEIKSHAYVRETDVMELALYWRLLEPLQQGPRDETRRGYVTLNSGESREVLLLDEDMDRLEQLIVEVRQTKVKGARPKLVRECDHCTFKDEHLPLIYQEGDVSLVYDIGRKRRQHLEELGITTISQFAEADSRTLFDLWKLTARAAPGLAQIHKMQSHARALLENTPQIIGTNPVPDPGSALLLDLEYYPGHQVFLVGVLIVEDGKEVALHQKFAGSYSDEIRLMTSLTEVLMSFSNHPIVTWNGSGADLPALANSWSRLGLDRDVLNDVSQRHIDLYSIVKDNLRLPITRLTLKDVASYFGFQRTHVDLDSFLIPMKYERFLYAKDTSAKQEILDHNADDVRSLLFTWRALRRLSSSYD